MKIRKALLSLSLFAIITIILSSCSFSFTTANLDRVQMAAEVDSDYGPVTVTDVFSVFAPEIYLTGTVKNAPKGTIITARWVFTQEDPDRIIDDVDLAIENQTTNFVFSLPVPDEGWPAGTYEVKIFIDGEYDRSVNFTVER